MRSKRVVKAVLSSALVLAMGVTTLFANATSSYAAGEMTLNKTSRNILTRQSFDFDVEGAPKDAVITWTSSDDKVATVDENGVVTGIKKGEVTITCKVKSAGETTTLTATAKICKPAVKVEIINKIKEMGYDETYDLNRELTPKTSNDVTTWKSSDTKVATVDKNGVVTPVKAGKVTITATTMSGKTDSVQITVVGSPEATPTPKPTAKPDKPSKPAASSDIEYKFADIAPKGYGYEITATNKDSVDVAFAGQYQEVQYDLPKAVDMKDCEKLTIKMKTASTDAGAGVAIKVITTDAELDQYNNPTPAFIQWGFVSADAVEFEVPLADLAGKQVSRITFMANDGACAATVYNVKFDMKAAAPAAKTVKYSFKDVEPKGYGYEVTATNSDSVDVAFAGQYQEVQYDLPEAVDMKNIEKMTVKLKTEGAVAIKVITTDAELDQYNNPTPAFIQWGFVADSATEFEVPLADLAGKKVSRVTFMANDGACAGTFYDVTFVPKK